MSYQSFGFIVFSAIVLLLYYLVGRKRQLWVLALANLTFYAIAGVQYIPFILVTTVATFLAGKKMSSIYQEADEKINACTDRAEKKQLRTEAKAQAKKALVAGMFVTLALLVVCKYTTFILENLNFILVQVNIPQITIFKMVLPLGISFYSFMALSYVLDIYWKRYQAEQNFLVYATYLSYFPHVVQGPIDRFNEFKEQVKDGIAFSYKNITYGAQLAIWGFFKKLVIADRLGLFVDTVFDTWQECDGIIIIASVIAYSIQIYADFSGCIDIVTGVSEMFGIQHRKNFNHPYFSKTMPEFWRRWHISLQEWFKDYIYYPVSTSNFVRNGKKYFKNKENLRGMELFSSCFPVLVVWMITGIWHGADWKYVAWGMFHAMLLIGSQIFDPFFKKMTERLKINTEKFSWHLWQMARSFALCCIGRVFFRADGIVVAFQMLYKMFTSVSVGALIYAESNFGMTDADVLAAIVGVIVLWIVDMLQEKMSIRETLAKQHIVLRWVIIYVGLFAVILMGIYGPGYDASSFIYEQF